MKTKAIAAIMVTVLLVGLAFNVVPVLAVEPIKIGVLGPMYWFQGQGIQEGATLAAEEINDAGGILGHSVELHSANTHPDAGTWPTNETGAAAMNELMSYDVDFVIGTFSSQAASGAREVAMDYQKIFIITGAAITALVDCANVYDPDGPFGPTPPGPCGACARCDYERYKYLFRVTPVNSSALFWANAYFSKYTMVEKLMPLYTEYAVPLRIAVVSEDASWADIWHDLVSWENWWNYNPTMRLIDYGGVDIVYETRVDPVDPTGIPAVVAAIDASGAKLIIEALSGPVGRDFAIEWATAQVEAALVGIDVFGQQIPLHWDVTGGLCEYETIMTTTGTRTPITSLSIPFWDAYIARWGHDPIYTSFGAYETIYTLKEAIETFGHWPPTDQADYDNLIPILEQTDRQGVLGNFKFTGPNPGHNGDFTDYDPSTAGNQPYPYLAQNPTMMGTLHDIFCASLGPAWPDGYARPLFAQWQAGRLEVIWPADQPYSEDFALPPWMLNTPVGSDVTVTDPIADVNTTFSETTSVGTTTVTVSDTGPSPPTGFSLAGLYYDITTTASYTGPIYIAIEYDETLVENEEDLKLLHWNPVSGTWEDATTWVDTANNIIYGLVASLSLFAVMEQLGIPATVEIDPDTLNLKSNGPWVTAYMTLPEGYNVEDIVLGTVEVDGISAEWSEIQNGVYMAKFDRATVQTCLTNEPDYESAPKFYDLTLTVKGELVDGTQFEGSDTITVIKR